jgi:hypothetical protein
MLNYILRFAKLESKVNFILYKDWIRLQAFKSKINR